MTKKPFPLAYYIDLAVKVYGTQHAVAEQMGVASSNLGRARTRVHGLNVLNCLRLAKIIGAAPSDVLRAAGKGEVAGLIEELYAPKRRRLAS